MWYRIEAFRIGGRYLAVRLGRGGRGRWGKGAPMKNLLRDVRYAVRSFRRTPGFLVVAVGTLALGIGANTAIFSVVNGVLLRPLDFPESDRLVRLGHAVDGQYDMGVTTPGNFMDWRDRASSFQALAAYSQTMVNWTGEGDPERVLGYSALGGLFEVLGVPPLLGRTFTAGDDRPGPEDIVVLSYGFWQRAFGGENPVGGTVELNGRSFEVVAVMPQDFAFPSPDVQFWITSSYDEEFLTNRTEFFLRAIGRLAPGVTHAQALDEMERIGASLREEHPVANGDVSVSVIPFQEIMVRDVRSMLWVLMGAVTLVLVIACLNLANLLLSRAAGREREVSVRTALGASRSRIVRQLLTEGAVLAAMGGLAGLAVGVLFLRAIVAWLPGGLPRVDEIGVDGAVLAFTMAATGVSAIVFGAVPSLRATGAGMGERLRRGGRGVVGGGSRSLLIVAEVALAVVLLTGAGLMTRSFMTLSAVDPGYESESRLIFRVSVPAQAYDTESRVAFFRELEGRLAALPGVRAVGLSTAVPGTGEGSGAWLNIVGRTLDEGVKPRLVQYRVVNPGYLATMGVGMVRGRMINRDDGLTGTPAVVINEAMAGEFWPGEDPLGERITLGPDGGWIPPSTIVGIVENMRMDGLDLGTPPAVFAPHELMPWWTSMRGVVHASVPAESLTGQVRATVRELNPALPVYAVDTVERTLDASIAPQRNSMTLLSLLSAVALTMAVVGVFGVLSFSVNRRTREIGIRMALGADAAAVQRTVIQDGMAPVLLGVGLGLGGAMVLTRFMESLLFNVSATDPATLALVSMILTGAAFVAIYVPARRATRVDPVRALAAE